MASMSLGDFVNVEAAAGLPLRGLEQTWHGLTVGYQVVGSVGFAAPPSVSADSTPAYPLLPTQATAATGLPKNGLVTATAYTVRGQPFGERKLSEFETLWGATVTPADGSAAVFVVDFHGLRTIGSLRVGAEAQVAVKPWEGVRFAQNQVVVKAGDMINLLTQKLEITLSGSMPAADFRRDTVIGCLNYPSNVRFVLMAGAAGPAPAADKKLAAIPFAQATGKEPILWTYNGDLAGKVALPDFSQAVNDFLEASQTADGQCHPQLVAYSDTPGFLALVPEGSGPGVTMHYLTTVQFPGADPLSTTVSFRRHDDRQTRVLTLFQPGTAPAGLSAGDLRLRIKQITLALSGQMDADRPDQTPSWGAKATQTTAAARVSSVFSLAQPFRLASNWPVTGVDLFLTGSSSVALVLELCGDQGGVPAGGVLAGGAVDGSQLAEAGGWVTVRLAQPLAAQAGTPLWIVLKAQRGEALWQADLSGEAGDQTLLFSRDGAFWRSHEPALAGWHKIMVLPDVSQRPAPLVVTATGASRFELAPAPDPRTVVLPLGSDQDVVTTGQALLTLEPMTKGQIKLANVVVEYAPEPATAPPV